MEHVKTADGAEQEQDPNDRRRSTTVTLDDDNRVHFGNEEMDVPDNDPAKEVIGVIAFMQENSIPLLLGVFTALILANVATEFYQEYLGGGIPCTPEICPNSTWDHSHADHDGTMWNGETHSAVQHGAYHRQLETGMHGKVMFTRKAPLAEMSVPLNTHSIFSANYYVHEAHRRLGGGGNVKIFALMDGCLQFFGHPATMQFISNDLVICFFFGIAAKEITESVLPGGSLNPPKKAATPLIATLGGVFGPIIVFIIFTEVFWMMGLYDEGVSKATLLNGWGIVTATDIALAWVVAKKTFGAGHPAIDFLLLLAIADDGLGLIIVAIFYGDPANPAQPVWLLLVVLAMLMAYTLRKWYYRKPKGQRVAQSWSTYVIICGPVAWIGLIKAHLHPALALCFIVPFMPGPDHDSLEHLDHPHKKDDDADVPDDTEDDSRALSIQAGLYAGIAGHHIAKELQVVEIDSDTGEAHHHGSCLDRFEHECKLFVDFSLGFFALTNAGVKIEKFGGMAASIYLSLVVGKILGIVVASKMGEACGFPLPKGVGTKHLFMVGLIASIGLTVALFVSDAAFEDPILKGEAKMGALLSAVNGLIALAIGRCVDMKSQEGEEQVSLAGAGASEALSSADVDGNGTELVARAGGADTNTVI